MIEIPISPTTRRARNGGSAAGVPTPSQDDAIHERISVTPANAVLSPGDEARVLVHGPLHDDATNVMLSHWASANFTRTDEAARVGDRCSDGGVRLCTESTAAAKRAVLGFGTPANWALASL